MYILFILPGNFIYLKSLALLSEQRPVLVWEEETGSRPCPDVCAGHARYPSSAPTAMLLLVLVLLLLIGVSVCSVSSFSCSTISHLRWTRCSFAQVSALGVSDICSLSIFKFFFKKKNYKACMVPSSTNSVERTAQKPQKIPQTGHVEQIHL